MHSEAVFICIRNFGFEKNYVAVANRSYAPVDDTNREGYVMLMRTFITGLI